MMVSILNFYYWVAEILKRKQGRVIDAHRKTYVTTSPVAIEGGEEWSVE